MDEFLSALLEVIGVGEDYRNNIAEKKKFEREQAAGKQDFNDDIMKIVIGDVVKERTKNGRGIDLRKLAEMRSDPSADPVAGILQELTLERGIGGGLPKRTPTRIQWGTGVNDKSVKSTNPYADAAAAERRRRQGVQ